MTGSYILCNQLHRNGLMTDWGLIFLARVRAYTTGVLYFYYHICHTPTKTLFSSRLHVTVKVFNPKLLSRPFFLFV